MTHTCGCAYKCAYVCVCLYCLQGRLFFSAFLLPLTVHPHVLCVSYLSHTHFFFINSFLFSQPENYVSLELQNNSSNKKISLSLISKIVLFQWKSGFKQFFFILCVLLLTLLKQLIRQKTIWFSSPAFTASAVTTSCFPARGFRPSRHRALGVNTVVMCVYVWVTIAFLYEKQQLLQHIRV